MVAGIVFHAIDRFRGDPYSLKALSTQTTAIVKVGESKRRAWQPAVLEGKGDGDLAAQF
jgi:hypothetical protein